MIASKESQHLDRVADGEAMPVRLLQAGAVWGGNASGKSNFTKALQFAQHLVVCGTRPDGPTGRIPFKLRDGAATEPSRFEFEVLVEVDGEEKVFRYIFAVTGREVVEESLTEIRSVSEKVYFTRKAGATAGDPVFTMDWWERKVVSEEDRQFARFVAKGTKVNQLFLHEAMDRNVPLLAPVFRWFRDQLVVLEPDADYLSLETLEAQRQDLRDFVTMMLGRADTGIVSVVPEAVPVDSLGLPPKVRDNLFSELKDEGSGLLLRAPNGRRYSVFRKDGELMASRIVTYRRSREGKEVAFETSEESDGTLRLFDLAPVFHDLTSAGCRRVYVIDELDRSMHSQLTRALLEGYFASRSKATRSQLIFTTHDAYLMDQQLLRRDEIWFIERGPHGETCLESLSDYKEVRYDRDIRKAYLEGRYSGVPHLRPFGSRMASIDPDEALESMRLNEGSHVAPETTASGNLQK